MIEIGSVVKFTKFDGGKIESAEGTLEGTTVQFIQVQYNGKSYQFKRTAGPKAGWGVKDAKSWRLDESSRRELCDRDQTNRRI